MPSDNFDIIGVALRKESVDRNSELWGSVKLAITSLSARRAWIEIPDTIVIKQFAQRSLSARRAWIEISVQCRL